MESIPFQIDNELKFFAFLWMINWLINYCIIVLTTNVDRDMRYPCQKTGMKLIKETKQISTDDLLSRDCIDPVKWLA